MIVIAAWVATVLILGTYGVSVRMHQPCWFNWANVLGCPPLAIVGILAHAWPNVAITLAFGAIGVWGVVRGGSENRQGRRDRGRAQA